MKYDFQSQTSIVTAQCIYNEVTDCLERRSPRMSLYKVYYMNKGCKRRDNKVMQCQSEIDNRTVMLLKVTNHLASLRDNKLSVLFYLYQKLTFLLLNFNSRVFLEREN